MSNARNLSMVMAIAASVGVAEARPGERRPATGGAAPPIARPAPPAMRSAPPVVRAAPPIMSRPTRPDVVAPVRRAPIEIARPVARVVPPIARAAPPVVRMPQRPPQASAVRRPPLVIARPLAAPTPSLVPPIVRSLPTARIARSATSVRPQPRKILPSSGSPVVGRAAGRTAPAVASPTVAAPVAPLLPPRTAQIQPIVPSRSAPVTPSVKRPLTGGMALGLGVATPLAKGPNRLPPPASAPTPGVVAPLKPVSVTKLPPPRAPITKLPRWSPRVGHGPAPWIVPRRFAWHPWAGRRSIALFGVAVAATAVPRARAEPIWSAPPPSCYVGGAVSYAYPGTRICFDFAAAVPGDAFECAGRIYRWTPARYASVEALVEAEEAKAEPAAGWIERAPARATVVRRHMQRSAIRAQSVARVAGEALDCSSCLTAYGPTPAENGQCTISLVNNCPHAVSLAGGIVDGTAPSAGPSSAVCDFTGDLAAGTEAAVCTKPCAELADAQVFLNGVMPAAGTPTPSMSCRVPGRQARAP